MPTAAELVAHLRDHPDDLVEPLEDHLREFDWSWGACLRAVLSVPESDGVRLMCARWLEENAGAVPCGACDGHWMEQVGRAQTYDHAKQRWVDCPTCRGTGRAPDGRRDRAEFIRVQVENAVGVISAARQEYIRARERELFVELVNRRLFGLPNGFDPVMPNSLAARIGEIYGPGDMIATVRRGFVEAVTLTAADWLAHHEPLYWHPDQRVPCENCDRTGLEGVGLISEQEGLISDYDVDRYKESWRRAYGYDHPVCTACSGEGTVPRPFVPTAQPIRVVTLTTEPDEFLGLTTEQIVNEVFGTEWPGVTFHLPG